MSKPVPMGRSQNPMRLRRVRATRRSPMHWRSTVRRASPPLSSTSSQSALVSGPRSPRCPSKSPTGKCSVSWAPLAGIPLNLDNGVEIRQRISVMPESPGLYLRLTVTENLEYFAGLYGLRQAGTRINDALEAVNLGDRAGDLCGGLSKGLRQRVGLARTLLSDPKIMFLDEPTSGLDPVAALEVHNLISGLRHKGVTIFLPTHRLEEAEKLCDRVAILNTTLRTVGRPAELREQLFKNAPVGKRSEEHTSE